MEISNREVKLLGEEMCKELSQPALNKEKEITGDD